MRTRAVRAVALAAVVTALAGCSLLPQPEVPPGVVETPDIVWQPVVEGGESVAPAEELLSNQYAQVVDESMLAFVLASNSHDWSIEQLSSSTVVAITKRWYRSDEDERQHDRPITAYIGPVPHRFDAVNEVGGEVELVKPDRVTGDTVAEVVVCVVHDWSITLEQPEAVPGTTATVTYYYVADTDDGLRVESIVASDTACDATGILFGRFDPAPTVPNSFDYHDVRPPVGVPAA